jgi:hypothetical protein
MLTAKCSRPSAEAAQTFGTDYCALVEPCCTSQGLTSQGSGTLRGAALGLEFDPAAGTTCLAALHARQAGPDFCGSLATVHPSWNNDSAVIPECLAVACSPTISFPSECLAGFCNSPGTCPSSLSPLCF